VAAQGTTFAKFVERQADAEYDRRTSLDARGLGVVTSNGAFTTLIFGLLVVLKGRDFTLTPSAKIPLIVALASLMLSALVGLYATQLVRYTVTDATTLRDMIGSHWKDSEVDARNACAATTIKTVDSLRTGNNKKAGRIVVAVAFQLLGFVSLAVSASIVLLA
jgi:hypothetical protein